MQQPMNPINPSEHEQTRRRLSEGSWVAQLRADPPRGMRLRSDAELEASLEATLRQHEPCADLHVFCYGSLMWNPALEAIAFMPAQVRGWHRSFCLRLLLGRGTVEAPGAMLALDRGGSCRGTVLRIEAAKVRAEARLLWRREMLAGSYDARWVRARVGAVAVRALTFVVKRDHDRYIGRFPIESVAQLIRTGSGPLGSSRAYFDALLHSLARLGIEDAGMARLRHAIDAADRCAGPA